MNGADVRVGSCRYLLNQQTLGNDLAFSFKIIRKRVVLRYTVYVE